MPHHKSCVKRLRISGEERVRNNALKTVLRKTMKEVRAKIVDGESFDLNNAYSDIDRVCSKGVIPKKRASRLKSRLAKAAGKITATKN